MNSKYTSSFRLTNNEFLKNLLIIINMNWMPLDLDKSNLLNVFPHIPFIRHIDIFKN